MRPSLRAAFAATVAFSIGLAPWPAAADNLVGDGDELSGEVATLNFGGICRDDSASRPVSFVLDRSGQTNNQTWANSTLVTVSTPGASSAHGVVSGTNTSATTLSDWVTAIPSNDNPKFVNVDPSTVTVSVPALGATDGAKTATITYTGTGAGASTASVSRSDTVTVNWTVLSVAACVPPNAVPVANNDNYSVNEDGTLNVPASGVLGNDTDADSNPLTAALVAGPANGDVTLNANGSFDYSPDANYFGADSFTYKANDGTVDSATATVNLTVNPVNDQPTLDAIGDVTVAEDSGAGTVNLAGISAGPANESGQTLTVTATSGDTSLLADPSVTYTSPNATGSLTFTPEPNQHGSTTVTVTVTDDGGGTDSRTRTFTVTVTPVNDTPVASDDSASTNEDEAVVVDVLANDADVDGDTLSVVGSSLNGTNGSATLISGGADDGKVLFTPNANFNGSASFTYQVNDGTEDSNVADVDITVVSVNDAPVADNDAATTTEDNAVVVDVLDGDGDVDGDSLSVVASSLSGTNGSATLISGGADDGKVLFTPNADFFGAASFTYKVTDGTDESNEATVSVTVTPVNDNPVADDDSATTAEDSSVDVDVLDGDTDVDGDTLSIDSVGIALNGTTSIVAGQVRYTPDANFYGSDSFTYQVCDDASTTAPGDELCDEGSVTITVTAVNDAPVVTAGSNQTTVEGTSVTVDATFTDVDQGFLEIYTATVDWGDGNITAATVLGNSVSASHTYADDEAPLADDDFQVTITVTDSGSTNGSSDPKSGSAGLTVHVDNVAPSVNAPTVSLNPVTGVLSLSTTFSDPAGSNDAPYTGRFIVDGSPLAGTVSGSSMTASTTLSPGCHSFGTTAEVTDNDDGTGTSAATSLIGGDVYTASFLAPIRDDVRNIAKYGNVVPVKVQLGSNCTPGTTVTTASLYLTIVKGDATGDDTVNDDSVVVATSVSNADTGTQMRVSDGKYIYNLSTKTMTPGQDYTIRVRTGSATGPIILKALFQPKK